MGHILKYRAGEKVKIVGDQFESHGEDIGTECTIVKTEIESRKLDIPEDHQEYFLDCDAWVTESDIEAISA